MFYVFIWSVWEVGFKIDFLLSSLLLTLIHALKAQDCYIMSDLISIFYDMPPSWYNSVAEGFQKDYGPIWWCHYYALKYGGQGLKPLAWEEYFCGFIEKDWMKVLH